MDSPPHKQQKKGDPCRSSEPTDAVSECIGDSSDDLPDESLDESPGGETEESDESCIEPEGSQACGSGDIPKKYILPTCIAEGCTSKRNAGKFANRTIDYCSYHARTYEPDWYTAMIEHRRNKNICAHNGCTSYRCRNKFNKKSINYCWKHARTYEIEWYKAMVNHYREYKQKTNPICIHDGCQKNRCQYIHDDKKTDYCVLHAREHDTIWYELHKAHLQKLQKLCILCSSPAPANKFYGRTSDFCLTHAKTEDKEYYQAFMKKKRDQRMCKHNDISGCGTAGTVEGYCIRCFTFLYPDHQRARFYMVKELCVRRYLTESFLSISIVYNKRVEGGDSARRPDALIQLETHAICIEVDEHQHTSANYECLCENKRLTQIYKDVNKPIVFIRFNPDSYINQSGVKVASCWTRTPKTNEPRVKQSSRSDWESRLAALKEHVEYWLMNVPDREIQVIQLFYDQG